MTRNTQYFLLLGTCSLLALGATGAIAQTAPAKKAAADDSTTVVVTAQKREQKLQDVPMAITVAGAAQLERQQITQVHDLDRVSPAVTFVDGAPGGGAGIRGIATQSFTPSSEASVGIVVDNVPQGNVNTSNLFDMERVEVLRGPQGMLFGQSASAGVINMVTKAPRIGSFDGRLHLDLAGDGTAGSKYGERVFQGVVNLPIDSHSAARVSVFDNRVNGVETDAGTGKGNVDDDAGFRVRYLNNLTDNLKLNLIADYDRDDQTGPSKFVFRKAVNASTISALAACGITASDKNTETCGAYPNYDHISNGGASAQFDYQMGDYTLTSVTSYRQRDGGPNHFDIVELKGVYPQLYYTNDRLTLKQTSQEFRITSPAGGAVEWVAGVYGARFNNWEDNGGLNIVIPDSYVPGATDDVIKRTVNKSTIETEALFGQLTWNLSPKLSALFGLRVNHETVSDSELFSQNIVTPIGVIAAYNNVPASLSTSVNNTSGRIGLQYKVDANLMIYGTLSRGYKGPQINDTVFGATPTVVRPELPTAFEIGAKGQVGRVGVDLNLFYDKVKDYQGQICVFTPALTCGATNVSEVVSQGVELDLFGKPIPQLTLNGGFIYNPVKYPSNYVGSDGTQIGGTQMTGAPVYKLNLSGEYVVALPSNYQGFISVDTTYKSLIHIYPSASADYDVKAHWITGGKVGVRFPDRSTSLALYVRNIGNTPDPVNIYPGPSTGDIQQIVGKQGLRVVGISLDKSF